MTGVVDLGGLSVEALLEHVDADPVGTRDEAARRVANETSELLLARMHWVIGLCHRGTGELESSHQELVLAVSLATSDAALRAEIQSSLAYVVGRLGHLDAALALLQEAEPHLIDGPRARLLSHFGVISHWRGEFDAAADYWLSASRALRHYGDELGELRALVNLGAVCVRLGRDDLCQTSLDRAVALGHELGQHLLVATAHHNLGFLASRNGDVAGALQRYDEAERGMREAAGETYLASLHLDHAHVLAEAALFADASELMRRALEMYIAHGNEIEVADGLVLDAELRLAQGDLNGARTSAEEAEVWFSKQGRTPCIPVARHVGLQAISRTRPLERNELDLARDLEVNADDLDRIGHTAEAMRGRLYAAKLRGDVNATDGIDPVPADVRRAARRGRASDQILLAHIDAVVAGERHDRAGIRRAVTRGLRTAMSAQAALGSIETRAHAAVHGYALTEIGARVAVADGRPRELLERIEATRMMSSRLPSLRPPADPDMASMLTELRSLNATVADPSSSDEQRSEAERARGRVERDIRRRSRTVRGDAAPVGVREELGSALALLGDRHLLAHAALDGRLYAVSVIDRRARLHDLGELEGVSEMIGEIAFSLNRLNRVQGSEASRTAAAEMLYMVADELAELLLPSVVVDSMAPVVVVPTAVLHDVPWGLLPPLGGRAVSVNPSVSAWARAERTRQERRSGRTGLRSVGFMAGPGLAFADFEVENLAKSYIDPSVSTGADATVAVCVDLLAHADLVHIACHGSFRTDNPMFSSLHLADGPLIVHDLERLDRLPETVVLPACSVATAKALQGGSLLGLATALTTLGACNVIAPLTPINDASSVTVMERLHRGLVAGEPPAQALAEAAMAHDVTDPTAGAFITLGA